MTLLGHEHAFWGSQLIIWQSFLSLVSFVNLQWLSVSERNIHQLLYLHVIDLNKGILTSMMKTHIIDETRKGRHGCIPQSFLLDRLSPGTQFKTKTYTFHFWEISVVSWKLNRGNPLRSSLIPTKQRNTVSRKGSLCVCVVLFLEMGPFLHGISFNAID